MDCNSPPYLARAAGLPDRSRGKRKASPTGAEEGMTGLKTRHYKGRFEERAGQAPPLQRREKGAGFRQGQDRCGESADKYKKEGRCRAEAAALREKRRQAAALQSTSRARAHVYADK